MKVKASFNGNEIRNPLLKLVFGIGGVLVAVLLILFVAIPLLGLGVGLIGAGTLLLLVGVSLAFVFEK